MALVDEDARDPPIGRRRRVLGVLAPVLDPRELGGAAVLAPALGRARLVEHESGVRRPRPDPVLLDGAVVEAASAPPRGATRCTSTRRRRRCCARRGRRRAATWRRPGAAPRTAPVERRRVRTVTQWRRRHRRNTVVLGLRLAGLLRDGCCGRLTGSAEGHGHGRPDRDGRSRRRVLSATTTPPDPFVEPTDSFRACRSSRPVPGAAPASRARAPPRSGPRTPRGAAARGPP